MLEARGVPRPQARIVWASSCEVYGSARGPARRRGRRRSRPQSPYAVSKAAGDMLAGVYARAHGLAICRARAFNHAGPGQLPIFIVSSLAQSGRAGATPRHASAVRDHHRQSRRRRDFTDVRDVVRAYRLLARDDVPPGVYNVCSGVRCQRPNTCGPSRH